VQDVDGFTALHCAYSYRDLDSVGILKRYGADEDIEDNLGRRPLDMYIPSTDDLAPMCLCSRHMRLVSDGEIFFEVLSQPSSPPDFAPAPTHLLPDVSTPASTAHAIVHNQTPFSAPPPPSSTHVAGIGGPQPAMSQSEARALIVAYILASAWFTSHAMEPCVGELGVPDSAILLAEPGHSIWACFFKRVRRNGVAIFKCVDVGCGHKPPD
jgi:hypothetical protein